MERVGENFLKNTKAHNYVYHFASSMPLASHSVGWYWP